MSQRILKYPLGAFDSQAIETRTGACVLSVQSQAGGATLWLEVNEALPPVVWTVERIATGEVFEGPASYLGTVQEGRFVWHYYRRH